MAMKNSFLIEIDIFNRRANHLVISSIMDLLDRKEFVVWPNDFFVRIVLHLLKQMH